jgi:RimJ/RimL family protein N-acetyltransferase
LAGIKLLEKRPEHLNFIVNELLKPELRGVLFDDAMGFGEINILLYDPFTFIYGVFEKGHPVPIGCVILEGLRPFRGCQLHAAIFKPENRNAKKMEGIAQMVKNDLLLKWNLHYVEARIVAGNVVARHLLEKLGFTKVGTKPGNIVTNGKYTDVDEYYVVINGEKLLEIDTGGV